MMDKLDIIVWIKVRDPVTGNELAKVPAHYGVSVPLEDPELDDITLFIDDQVRKALTQAGA